MSSINFFAKIYSIYLFDSLVSFDRIIGGEYEIMKIKIDFDVLRITN